MSHTLVLENFPATKWSRYPWSTQLGSLGCGCTQEHVCPYMVMVFTQGHAFFMCFWNVSDNAKRCIFIWSIFVTFQMMQNYAFSFDPFCNIKTVSETCNVSVHFRNITKIVRFLSYLQWVLTHLIHDSVYSTCWSTHFQTDYSHTHETQFLER